MRALVVGDIHTEDALLASAIGEGLRQGVDRFLSVGDIVDGPNDPRASIELLRRHDFLVVRGNHERWVVEGTPLEPFDYPVEELGWLAGLPATRELDTPTGQLLLGHGIGDDDMARLRPDTSGYALEVLDGLWELVRARRFRWLIGGHTHQPMVRSFEGLTVINPGTLVHFEDPGFMLVDFARGEIERWTLSPAPTFSRRWSVG